MSELKPTNDHLWPAIRRMGIEGQVRAQAAVAAWSEAVGEHLARVSQAERLQNGVLWIVVTNSAWSQEILFRREMLRHRINTSLGKEMVRDIRIRVGTPRPRERTEEPSPPWAPYRKGTRGRSFQEAVAELHEAIRRARQSCSECGRPLLEDEDACPNSRPISDV